MVFLTGERITLRSLSQNDTESMFIYRNSPVCSKYQRGQVKKKEEISTLVERMSGKVLFSSRRILVAIARKDDESIIGELAVVYDNGCVTLGYTVSPENQRKGYAYEALSLFLAAHFEKFPRAVAICYVVKENEASKGLLLKLGFDYCGYDEERDALVFKKNKAFL